MEIAKLLYVTEDNLRSNLISLNIKFESREKIILELMNTIKKELK